MGFRNYYDNLKKESSISTNPSLGFRQYFTNLQKEGQKEYIERQAKIAAEYVANQKAYDDLLNFDVNAGQDEINNLEAILKKANELSFSPTAPTKAPTTVTRNGMSYSVDSKGNYSITPSTGGKTRVEAGYTLVNNAEKATAAQYEYLKENGYSSIDELRNAINQKKQYLNDAKSTQSTHAALSKYNKTKEENEEEINSLYTDLGTKKANYEENGKSPLDWISKGIAAFMYGDSPKNIAISNEESEYMSASENYYTAKYGTKAEQQELLNIFKQSGDSKYSQEIKELTHSLYGDSAFDEYVVGNVEAGARNFFYETAATFNAITSIFGLPIDETKAYQDLKKSAEAQNAYASNAAIALGDTDNIGGNLIQVAMAFIPDLILTVATKGSSGGGATATSLGKIASAGIKTQKTASMTNKFLKYGSGMLDAVSKGISATAKNPMFWTSFSRTFGTDYETALEGGADTTTAYLYATITSITNALVEIGGGVESRLPDVISGKSKFQILDFIKECIEEGNEEVIQGVITNLNQLLYDSDKEFFSLENEDAIINPSRMLKEHAMGTLGGAVLGGGTKIGQRIISGSTRGITLAGKSAIRNNMVSDLAEFGRTAADENVRSVSESFLTSGKITNYDAGVLFAHAQKQINYDLNLAKTPAKTRAAIKKYIKGDYPEAIKQMVIGNEIAKMYDISDIANKVSQREYSFSTNENNGGIIKSSENNENGGLNNAEINTQKWGQSGNTQRGTGLLQENLGRNDDQSGGAWLEQRGSQNSRSGESGGNRRLSFEQSQNLKNTSIRNLDGTPKKVYHFTENMNFEVFEKGDIGFHFGNEQQAGMRGKLLKKSGRIIVAYLNIKKPIHISSDIMTWRPRNLALRLLSDGVISVEEYRAIQTLDAGKEYSYNSPAAVELRRILSEKGYDGIVYQNMFEGDGESYIAFYPEQVIIIDDGKSKNTVAPATKEKSILTEPDLTADKPQSFEEMAMENITGEKLRNENQRRVESIARLLNQKVEWYESADITDRGYYENGIIHINIKANQPYTVVFTHEFCHHLQRSGNWNAFVSFSRSTPVYKQWICEKGGSADIATAEANYKAQIKKAYESKTGSAYNDTRLTNEIMARFVSEKMMVEYASGQNTELATATEHFLTEIAKNRKWYHVVMDWISEMINRLTRRHEQADFLKFQRMLKQAYNDVQSRAATADTGREYDIITLDSGKSYVKASRKIIFGDNVSEWRKQISAFFNKALENGPIYINTIEGDTLKISKETADKARDINISENGITRKLTHNEFLVKLHAESHIDELAEISTKNNKGKIVPDAKNHSFAKDGFTYRTVYFEDFDGTYYKITLSIGQNGNVSTVYNVGKIKADDIPNGNIVSAIGSKADMSSTIHSIRDSAENSKENFKNRDYSFDEDKANSEDIYFEPKKERVTDGGELRVPASVYARELLRKTGSSYNRNELAKEIEKIYIAADKGHLDEVVSLSQQTAENLIDNVEFAEYEQQEREIEARNLMRQISLQVQDETKATVRRFRLSNGSLKGRNYRLQEKNADLESKNKELNRTHEEIRAEERVKFEAAQQRKTDRNVIKRSINRLDKKFRANSNNKHVPEVLKDTVKAFLDIFLENDPRAFEKREISRVRAMYERLVGENPEITRDPDTEEKLKYLEQTMEGKTISKLTDSELQMVREIAEHFSHLVTSANEIFVEGKREDFKALANEEAERLEKMPQKRYANLGDGKFRQGLDEAKEFLNEGNLKPVYFFEKLDGVYKKLFDDISAGLDKTVKNINKATVFLQDTLKKYNYWSWVDKKQKIELGHANGQRITLTMGEGMSIYAVHKREMSNAHTQASNHLGVGGIVLKRRQIVEQIEKSAKDKNGTFDKLIQHHLITAWASSPYKITEADIKEIEKQLGKEKLAFVDELVNYMSTVGSALGNDASDKLYGYNKFGEKYYFPFETSKKFLAREYDNRQAKKTLLGKSFAKNTIEEATSPLVISDFTEVFCKHMTEMCEYNGLGVPLNNLKRVCGFVDKGDEKRAGFSLMNELERVHGAATINYLNKFIEDVDGGISGQQAGDNIAGSLISLFQKNAVAANLSVVIQQPSSIMRATAYIEPKYLFAKGSKFTNAAWEECQKYNGVAIQKEMGRFDIGNPKSTFDYMTDRQYKGLKDKAKGFVKDENYRDNLFSKAASKADQYTWCTIWNGCKAKIEATTNFEVGSEQFFSEAAKLFKEIIEHTQVYDSVLSRSQNMRSKSVWTRMATAFMGEPTTNLNMLHKALWDAKAGNMGAATKGVIGVLSATLLNAILKSLITAMRDDDEDKSYGEKYITEVGGNFLSDANPIGWVPIMKDVLSIFEGYQVKRADMNLVQDLYYGTKALGSSEKTTWEKILAVANPVSAMCGLPVENVARDIGAVINTVTTAVNDENEHTHGFKYAFLEGLPGEDSYAKYYEIMRDKQKKGDTQGYTELKEYLMGRGKTEKEIESGVKAAYSKSKAVTKQTDDYFELLAKNALFGKLSDEKQEDVKTAVKRYLTESAMNAATGKEMSKTNQKAAEAQKKGSSAVNYFLAKASFEDTDNSGGISNEEKIAAINKMNISAFEKQALIMLYTKK